MASRSARPTALLLLLAGFVAGCGPDGPEPVRTSSDWGSRDLLDEGAFRDGTSIETRRSRVVTRGTWELKSSNGSGETPVPDGGGFPMGTILFGSKEKGEGFRNVRFPLPGDIDAQQLTVRVYATDGELLRMRALAVGPQGPVPGEVVDFVPNSEPTDVVVL